MRRHCPTCGGQLTRTTTRGGLPRDVCPECDDADTGARYGGNSAADGGVGA